RREAGVVAGDAGAVADGVAIGGVRDECRLRRADRSARLRRQRHAPLLHVGRGAGGAERVRREEEAGLQEVSAVSVKAWILAARPKTLSASIVPVLVGTALARSVYWPAFAYALLGAIFIQIGTNLVNDALDFKRGADTADR